VKRTAKKHGSGSNPIRVREWRVVLIRKRGQFLGHVEATSLEDAEVAAAKLFGLSEFQRRRLLLQERM